MMERLIGRVKESQAKELDANRHRNSDNVFKTTSGNFEMIDYFSLELANKHVKRKFVFTISNIEDSSFMEDNKNYAKELLADTR